MAWEIEVSDEFKEWYESLTDLESLSVHKSVEALAAVGPALGRPHVDTLRGSRFPNMKAAGAASGQTLSDSVCV